MRTQRVYTDEYKRAAADRQRARRKANPDYMRESGRKSERKRKLLRYGLTEDMYKALFQAQGNCCAICKTSSPGSKRDWHVDHCHTTLVVRGILCHHCNLMLGMAKDSKTTLQQGINYLQAYD